jgi:hypothetical protein
MIQFNPLGCWSRINWSQVILMKRCVSSVLPQQLLPLSAGFSIPQLNSWATQLPKMPGGGQSTCMNQTHACSICWGFDCLINVANQRRTNFLRMADWQLASEIKGIYFGNNFVINKASSVSGLLDCAFANFVIVHCCVVFIISLFVSWKICYWKVIPSLTYFIKTGYAWLYSPFIHSVHFICKSLTC